MQKFIVFIALWNHIILYLCCSPLTVAAFSLIPYIRSWFKLVVYEIQQIHYRCVLIPRFENCNTFFQRNLLCVPILKNNYSGDTGSKGLKNGNILLDLMSIVKKSERVSSHSIPIAY